MLKEMSAKFKNNQVSFANTPLFKQEVNRYIHQINKLILISNNQTQQQLLNQLIEGDYNTSVPLNHLNLSSDYKKLNFSNIKYQL